MKFSFMQFKQLVLISVVLAGLQACKDPGTSSEDIQAQVVKDSSEVRYARRFAIRREKDFTLVYLFGDRRNYDTTATYVLYSNPEVARAQPVKGIYLKSPCTRIAALSSIYATMFCELGVPGSLAAIDNIDYVNNPLVINKFKAGELKELMKTPQIDLEKTIVLKPDVVFTFGMGEGDKDRDKRFDQTRIPMAISVDHLEESPLARAEWIKFFAAFVNRSAQADSIFNLVEQNYENLRSIAAKTTRRPTVFSELKYSDFWYMPGGKSYVACLLKDAGADYLWRDDPNTGSLPLSFEQVFAKAGPADYWINLSTLKTKKELLGFESRYAEFKAFKTGNLYNNTRYTNSKGYSNYWETGMIYPDRILSDLVQIFHPGLKDELHSELYYYERIE